MSLQDELEKQAGGWERAGLSAINVGLAIAQQRRLARVHEEHAREEHEKRHILHQQMRPATEALSRSRVPAMLTPEMGRNVPVGFEYGMIRLASAIGAEMAQDEMEKEALFGALVKAVSRGGAKATANAGRAAAGTAGNVAANVAKVKPPSGGFRPQTPNPSRIPPSPPVPKLVSNAGSGPSTVRAPSGNVQFQGGPAQRVSVDSVPMTQRGGAPLSSGMRGPQSSAPMTQPASTQMAPTLAMPAQSAGSVSPAAPITPRGGYQGATHTMMSAQDSVAPVSRPAASVGVRPSAGHVTPAAPASTGPSVKPAGRVAPAEGVPATVRDPLPQRAAPPPPTPNGKPAIPAPRQKPLPLYELDGQQPAGFVAPPAKPAVGTGQLPPMPHPKISVNAAPEYARPMLGSIESAMGNVPGYQEAQRAMMKGDAAPMKELLRRNPAARKNLEKNVQDSDALNAFFGGKQQTGQVAPAAPAAATPAASAGTVAPAQGAGQQTVGQVAAGGGGAGTVTPAEATAEAAAAGGGDKNPTENFMQRTGLFDAKGKLRTGRLGLMGAGLGLGYMGYQGGKALIDEAGSHPGQYTYNTGGNQVPGGLNQYGYPQF